MSTIWGYYGEDWRIEDSAYLAEIAQSSRELAEAVMDRQLERTNDIRTWLFEVLTGAVWGGRQEMGSALDRHPDPVVRIQGAAAALRMMVDECAEEEDVDAHAWTVATDVEDAITMLKHSRHLAGCLGSAQVARDLVLDDRRRSRHARVAEYHS